VIWTYWPGGEQDYCFDGAQTKIAEVKDIFGGAYSGSSCGAASINLKISDLTGPIIVDSR
jgi:hypothetical protein